MPQAKAGERETEKSLPQSNAVHLTAPSRRGRKRRAIRESPLQPVGNGLDRSVKLYQITRANTVRPYGWIDNPPFVLLREAKNLNHRKQNFCQMRFFGLCRSMTKTGDRGIAPATQILISAQKTRRKLVFRICGGVPFAVYAFLILPTQSVAELRRGRLQWKLCR